MEKDIARMNLLSMIGGFALCLFWVGVLGATRSYALAFCATAFLFLVTEYSTVKRALGY